MKTYGRNTHLGFIAELCESGKTQDQAFTALEPLVLAQIEPMIFTRNPDRSAGENRRMPKPMHEQLIELRNAIGRIYSEIERSKSGTGSTRSSRIILDEDYNRNEIAQNLIEETKPVASGKKRIETEQEKLERRLVELMAFCDSRAETDPVDSIGMRPFEAGGRLIPLGVPADAILDAISIHWSKDQRQESGIADFDFLGLSAQFIAEQDCESKWSEILDSHNRKPEPLHEMFGYVLVLAQARQPIYLYGQKGTGKSHLCKQIADYLRVPYGETPMSAGASRGDLLGRLTASSERPFIPAKFAQNYAGGGVFNFEEMDAALAEMIIVLNNALAGDSFENSMSGEVLKKHGDFIPMATANTLAMGATRDYIREKLDAATLDRWNPGRVKINFDMNVARHMLYKGAKTQ
jgi:hypothetical protein